MAGTDRMDTQKYLDRIKYNGTLDTSSTTLKKLCICHASNVPFEMFDMFGGQRKTLDLEKIYNNIVLKRRGGLCYENNGLFSWLLKNLGFDVKLIQAQLFIGTKFSPKFDHLVMMVHCSDGMEWLTDVTFGDKIFINPLKFEELTEQSQHNGVYRIRKFDEEFFVVERRVKRLINGREKNLIPGTWQILYKFDTAPRKFEDFQKMCDYHQDSEESFLKYNTISCLLNEDGIVITWGLNMCKKKYIDPYTDQLTEVKLAKTEKELREILKKEMGLDIDFELKVQARDFKGFTTNNLL
ncbi:arylamine N-acetyltransferase, pineal gland isozyme NAT-10-like [Clavelina lepadiformis]|uniref:arylamine N-acetyltransferase, pineal gland isozyme NAT-10-like n=1 Tax=Clavelina lepadiformis TaxID=159417 RepID=UPI004042B8AE